MLERIVDNPSRQRAVDGAGWKCVLTAFALAGALSFSGCKRNTEKTDAPVDTVDSATTADDNAVLRLRNLALAYLDAERHDDAARVLKALAALIPDEPMVPANLGLIELRESRLASAATLLETAAAGSPDDPEIAMLRARVADERGDDATARELLLRAVEANPDHLQARWKLADALRRARDDASRLEIVRHLEVLLEKVPANILVRLALTRELLDRDELDRARVHLSFLDAQGVVTKDQDRQLLADATRHIDEGNARAAWSLVTALDNVLKPGRPWQISLAEVVGPPVALAEPVRKFLVHHVSEPTIGPRGGPEAGEVTYRDVTSAVGLDAVKSDWATLTVTDDGVLPSLLALVDGRIELRERGPEGGFDSAESSASGALPAGPATVVTCAAPIDWNNDLRIDLAYGLGDGSVHVATRAEDGTWSSVGIAAPSQTSDADAAVTLLRVWDADVDGDLDLLVGRAGSRATLLRNHADGVWSDIASGRGVIAEGDTAWIDAASADLDEDGDVDLVAIDDERTLIRFANERSGRFERVDAGPVGRVEALALADFDNDGWIDLAFVTPDGRLGLAGNREGVLDDVRDFGPVARGSGRVDVLRPLDFDNDGWLDLLVVAGGRASLHRNRGGLDFESARDILPSGVAVVRDAQVVDHDADGDPDVLLVTADGRVRLWENDGGNRNGWQTVRLEAIVTGGQRNNSFGVGGFIELRAGRAYQKRLVSGPVSHFGLGGFGPADSIRVVWPNGVPQYVLEPESEQLVVEKQTLKGSCPFLLAWNGESFEFVTDLLWRSPLGMRINAQTVAQIDTTRDYVKIEAAQLRPRDGRYEITITAALWETIFFDAIELWAVDHPATVDVLVDERFVAPVFPPFRIHVVDPLGSPVSAVDHRGRDVLDVIATRDRNRLGGFAKGRYQGIAEFHYVDLDAGPAGAGGPAMNGAMKLVASGWIRPTDSSINVAISQGRHAPPAALSVSLADGHGGWIDAIANAGFPAGKLKTIVLDLPPFPSADRRVRLATNLEIYWDRLAFAQEVTAFDAQPATLSVLGADLKSVGFPAMVVADDRAPELPDYSRITHRPRWRDLSGRYTRYGDVRELIAEIDDRYVIMNAGDGIAIQFDASSLDALPPGWVRDFVLVTDGWVKDGDANTAASKTVEPLPYHGMTGYPDLGPGMPRTLDPDHSDWTQYHTRFVTPDPFRDRMRP